MDILIQLFMIVFMIIILIMSIKVVREDYRYVIFRIGKFFRIVGPGLILILPFVDKVVKVNLSEAIPGWQTLSEEQLNEKIKYYVLYKV